MRVLSAASIETPPLIPAQRARRRARNRLRAVASGLLLVLATPPISWYPLAWMALVPLFRALEEGANRREAFHTGFLFSMTWHAGSMYWIAWNSGTPPVVSVLSAIALAALLSFVLGLVAMGHRLLLRGFGRWGHLGAAVLWMANDVIWQNGDWSFPWITLALTQAASLPVLQLASVIGSVGLTGMVALLNALFTLARGRGWAFATALAIIVGVWGWGAVRETAVDRALAGKSIATVAIVQGNIDPDVKWELGPWHSLTIYQSLSEAMVPRGADLMVWPENAAPVYLRQDYRWRREMQEFVNRVGVPLVTGGRFADFEEEGRIPYNAAFLVEPDMNGRFSVYKKVFLVPFGERIPFQWVVPQLRGLDFGQAEFAPGHDIITWPLIGSENADLEMAPLICYEAIIPQAGRRSVEHGADLLVNMTNDGWFTGTGQQVQHLLLTRVRAVETGRAVVRSTNTGISAFIAPHGRYGVSLGADRRGVIVDELPPPVDTAYQAWGWRIRWGSIWATVALLLAASLLGAEEVRRWRRRT